VLKEVSVDIEPGQFVAIVGRSGAGKSSLMALLAGLYTPTSGSVLYDGLNLSEFDLRTIRRQLGIVTQSPYLFGTTIRNNIALAQPGAGMDEVVRAAKLAHIHEDIMAMPMGYETPLVDRGASLSGGQRQRIAIARALVTRPAILILDEATSALDGITERVVQQELRALACTRIVVAHRMSTIMNADLILVLQDGVLVERGRHEDLLAAAGPYAQLVQAQTALKRALDDLGG
jgi:ABC-type bacteriocin/lantibiotic exporter with double-glycine peptidase domain